MFDYLSRGGLVVDGLGAPARHADVAIQDGRVVGIGKLAGERATKTFDATGLVVAPGFVDIHTHYDAQLHWDGFATPSSLHGVTTVFAGNCGFTLAPLKPRDADYTRRMMAQVEGMPLAALERGLEWNWETFGDFLAVLDGGIAVNAGFLVGHCALRCYVMGESSLEREATEDEVDAMSVVLRRSLEAGGLGLSTTRSRTHPDHNGNPVPSRLASEAEVLSLCRVVGDYPGTTLEAITSGCVSGFEAHEIELFAQMSAHARCPLNWNVLNIDAAFDNDNDRLRRLDQQLLPSRRARELGGRVLALSMPVGGDLNMSMATYCAMWLIPGWREVMALPPVEKSKSLRDPKVRASLMEGAKGSGLERFAEIANYRIGDTVAPRNKQFEGRVVGDIARERDVDPWDALVDIEEADDFTTVLWPLEPEKSQQEWEFRRAIWELDDVLLGGSDAGAHLDRLLASSYPTRFIAKTVRELGLLSLERAIQLITDRPASLYGLTDRGRLTQGALADVVVFDLDTVASGNPRRVYDLPGNSLRLTAPSVGIELVLVNGAETVRKGEPTGELSGTVLRSGRDTETVLTR